MSVFSGDNAAIPKGGTESSDLTTVSGSFVMNLNKCTAEFKETVEEGMLRAMRHLTQYSKRFGILDYSVEIDDLMTFFRSCEAQFVRGNAEKAAREVAKGFTWGEGELDKDGEDLMRLGTISSLVNERRGLSAKHRFNAERCAKYFSEVSNAGVLMNLAFSRKRCLWSAICNFSPNLRNRVVYRRS